MPEVFDPYEILNVSEKDTQHRIKKSFDSISKAFHPDKQELELRKESREYFEQAEKAYKILSIPFRRFLFDHYGEEGIRIYEKDPNKFIILEEKYNHLATKIEELEAISQHEEIYRLKKHLSKTKKHIKDRVLYIACLDHEKDLNQKFQREVRIEVAFTAAESIHYYLFRNHSHQKQMMQSGITPSVRVTRYFMRNWVYLPSWTRSQNLLGVYVKQNTQNNLAQYGLMHQFQKSFESYGNLLLVTFTQLGTDDQSALVNLQSKIQEDYILTLQGYVSRGSGQSFTSKISKKLSHTAEISAEAGYTRQPTFKLGFRQVPPDESHEINCSLELESNSLGLIVHCGKKLTKHMHYYTEVEIGKGGGGLKFSSGFKLRVSGISVVKIATEFSGQGISLNFLYHRLGLVIKFPVLLSPKYSVLDVLFATTLNLVGAGFMKGIEHFRRTFRGNQGKLLKRSPIRMQEEIKTHQEKIDALQLTIMNKLLREKLIRGIIILKALYGNPDYVEKLYKVEVKLMGGDRVPTSKDPIALFQTAMDSIQSKVADQNNELADLRLMLQDQVRNGFIEISMEQLNATFYNPCLDEKEKPSLFLKFWLEGELHAVLIKADEERIFTRAGEPLRRTFRERINFNWLLP